MAASGSTLVFGGRGLVGAAVCRELAKRGAPVVSLGRSEGSGGGGPLDSKIEQISGIDALDPETFKPLLRGARAVVISMGLPPWIRNRERAISANALTNISVMKAAAECKVPRIILMGATMPSWGLIANYREAKDMAEAEARKYSEACNTDCSVVILKPGVVSGTRYVGSIPLPLWFAFAPMRLIFSTFASPCRALERLLPGLLGGVLRPAVHVDELAAAIADAAAEAELKGVRVLGTDELVGYRSRP